MGRGQARSRRAAAGHKKAARTREMRQRVKDAQKRIERDMRHEEALKQDSLGRTARDRRILERDIQLRQAAQREMFDTGSETQFSWNGHRRSGRPNTEAMRRRQQSAPRYDVDGNPLKTGQPTWDDLPGAKNYARAKTIDGNRRSNDVHGSAWRRDVNSNRVGGDRLVNYVRSRDAAIRRDLRNARRRAKYAANKAAGGRTPRSPRRSFSNLPRSQRPLTMSERSALLRRFTNRMYFDPGKWGEFW